jgi:hypothetical protein
MQSFSMISMFDEHEFLDFCGIIICEFIRSADLANPMRYTCPLRPVINVTEDRIAALNLT